MFGWIRYEEAGMPRTERVMLSGTAALCVRVPRGTGLRALFAARRAAALLAKRRVRLAVFPEDYPCPDAFLHRGIRPPDAAQLHRTCAVQIALYVLRERGVAAENATVALASERVCGELHAAAHTLVRTVRYLTLRTPDADTLALTLRREYGVAPRIVREGETLRADAALSFDTAAEGCIDLSDSCPALYSAELDGSACTDTALLAALLAAGALKAEQIRLERLIFPAAANFS